jgi:hypothetical protein
VVVGEAILDYIKHERPKASDLHLFFRAYAPKGPMTYGAISSRTSYYLRKAGISEYKKQREHRYGKLSPDAPVFFFFKNRTIHPATISQTFHYLLPLLDLDVPMGKDSLSTQTTHMQTKNDRFG